MYSNAKIVVPFFLCKYCIINAFATVSCPVTYWHRREGWTHDSHTVCTFQTDNTGQPWIDTCCFSVSHLWRQREGQYRDLSSTTSPSSKRMTSLWLTHGEQWRCCAMDRFSRGRPFPSMHCSAYRWTRTNVGALRGIYVWQITDSYAWLKSRWPSSLAWEKISGSGYRIKITMLCCDILVILQ